MRVKVGPVKFGEDDRYPTIEPPLDIDHAVGRLIFMPKELWPDNSEPGWAGFIGKIMKCHMGTKVATVKFHDATQYFPLSTVISVGRPVSS